MPTSVLKLRGSTLVKGRQGEPTPEAKAPRAPAWLDAEAQREWRYVVPRLVALGVLTEIDRTALAMYCQMFSDYLSAHKMAAEHGLTTMTDKGNVVQHPAVCIARKNWECALKAAREFGLTPSSRTGIRCEAKPDTSDDKRVKLKVG